MLSTFILDLEQKNKNLHTSDLRTHIVSYES